jgi:transposase
VGKKVTRQTAGIDVSGKSLQVALRTAEGEILDLEFPNDAVGHRNLVERLTKSGRSARVCLEATANFSLDVSLTLAVHQRIELMVVNPKAARRFAEAQMRRAKTDKVDARSLLDFVERMTFTPWVPPAKNILALRAITRRMSAMTTERVAEENRLAAAEATTKTPEVVLADIRASITALSTRIDALLDAALDLVKGDAELGAALEIVTSVRGIAAKSGVVLLAELLVLAKDMSPREVVAHCGLDPRPRQSGMRDGQRSISKIGNHIVRGALFMPALTAVVWEPSVKAYYEGLLARKKLKMVAVVAVMRRLLQALWVMLLRKEHFDGARFGAKNAAAA